ncbi:MAG: UvrD-helicase domain-containing protein [Anaerotruncus massiliensis (ex Togo et al. 2019)]
MDPRQRDAIEARGGTVLVSAAAGSGKTAVLVERAVGRILDSEQPVDADRLLVVTFSNAAALEMKQRIMARVTALAAEHPENARLRRQQLLLGRAQISTIHAFCSELIRQNFQLLGIASNIRTGDEKELEVLRRDCARGVVEEFFAREDGGRFARLVELLSTGRDDSRVFTTLFSLYDFVRSHPFYHGWMEAKLSYYNEGVPVADSIWGKCILGYAADALGHACALCGRALSLVEEDETLSNAYGGALRADLRQLERCGNRSRRATGTGLASGWGASSLRSCAPSGDDPARGRRRRCAKRPGNRRDAAGPSSAPRRPSSPRTSPTCARWWRPSSSWWRRSTGRSPNRSGIKT